MIIEGQFYYSSWKQYDVTPHLNRLDETIQMRGHNICFKAKFTKLSLIINKYFLLSRTVHIIAKVMLLLLIFESCTCWNS